MQTKYTNVDRVRAKVTTDLTDEEVGAIINLVSGYMDSFVGFKLATGYGDAPVDFLLDGSGTEHLMLPQPVCAYTRLDRVALDNSTTEELYTQSYPLNAPYTLWIDKKIGRFCAGSANYKLVGAKLGYFLTDFTTEENMTLPDEVISSATSLAVALINAGGVVSASGSNDTEHSGKITGETIGSYQVTYADHETDFGTVLNSVPTVTDILTQYKSLNIA